MRHKILIALAPPFGSFRGATSGAVWRTWWRSICARLVPSVVKLLVQVCAYSGVVSCGVVQSYGSCCGLFCTPDRGNFDTFGTKFWGSGLQHELFLVDSCTRYGTRKCTKRHGKKAHQEAHEKLHQKTRQETREKMYAKTHQEKQEFGAQANTQTY